MKHLQLIKKTFAIAVLMLVINSASAQIGINTNNPDSSVVLDISSDTKGILIPRLETDTREGYFSLYPDLPDGVIVYDLGLKKFFVWNEPDTKWEYINPWECDTTGEMILTSNVANKVTIEGDIYLNGNITTDGDQGLTSIIDPTPSGFRIVVKNGLIVGAGTTVGTISATTTTPYTTVTNGTVSYVQGTANPNWTIVKDELYGNPNAFNVSTTTGIEGTIAITYTAVTGQYGKTKFQLKEGANILDEIIMTAVETSGSFEYDTLFARFDPDCTGFSVKMNVYYTRGIGGWDWLTIEKDLTFGFPDNIENMYPIVLFPGVTVLNIWHQYIDCTHEGEQVRFFLMNGSQIIDTCILTLDYQ